MRQRTSASGAPPPQLWQPRCVFPPYAPTFLHLFSLSRSNFCFHWRLFDQEARGILITSIQIYVRTDPALRPGHVVMERSKSTHPARDDLEAREKKNVVSLCDDLRRETSTRSYDSGYGGYVSDYPRKASLPCIPNDSRTRVVSTEAVRAQSPPLPTPRLLTAHVSSVLLQSPSARNISMKSSRELVFELWKILQDQDDDRDTHDPLHTRERINDWAHDVSSPRTTTTGPGTNNSPKSSTTSTSISLGDVYKASVSATKRSSEENDEDEGPTRKKPNDNQNEFATELFQQPAYSKQMPCPMLEIHDCQGTNTTISELLRSLMNRHRIIICKECCSRIPVQDDGRKLANVLQKHGTECERRCIGSSCTAGSNDDAPHHRRTESCPSWATLTKEARWTFIWTLVNLGSSPPDPDFLLGPAYEHSQERRPCKQQARARVNEICADLMRDIEVKDRRISILEKDLAVAKDNSQRMHSGNLTELMLRGKDLSMARNETERAQQRCRERGMNLENIIENLLERLNQHGDVLPRSLRRRLLDECPSVMAVISTTLFQANLQSLPASVSPSSHAQYPWMASSFPNAAFPAPPPPPPPLSSTPDISAWQGTASQHQQVIGSNTRSHYSGLDPATTTNAMGQVNPHTSIWPSYQQQPYPPQHPGYPPQHPGYPPQQTSYPPQQPGYPLQQQSQSYDEQQQGYAVGGEAVDLDASNASDDEQDSTR